MRDRVRWDDGGRPQAAAGRFVSCGDGGGLLRRAAYSGLHILLTARVEDTLEISRARASRNCVGFIFLGGGMEAGDAVSKDASA